MKKKIATPRKLYVLRFDGQGYYGEPIKRFYIYARPIARLRKGPAYGGTQSVAQPDNSVWYFCRQILRRVPALKTLKNHEVAELKISLGRKKAIK